MVNWSWIINSCFVAPLEIPHCEQKNFGRKIKKYLVYLGLISTQQLLQKIVDFFLWAPVIIVISYQSPAAKFMIWTLDLDTLVIKTPSIPKHQQWEPDGFIIF